MLLSNALHSLFCAKFNIKIVAFSIFASKIKKVKIRGIDFILGWIPTTASVQPFAMDPDAFRHRELSETELKEAFFTKEDYKKAWVLFSPSIIYFVFGLVLPMLYLILQNDYSIHQHVMYIAEFFKSIWGDEQQINNFGRLTKEMVSSNTIVLFTFIMFSSELFIFSLLSNYGSYLGLKKKKATVLGTVLTILNLLITLTFTALIIITLLRYFSFSQIALYILNIVLGLYASGIIAYLVLVSCMKALKTQKP